MVDVRLRGGPHDGEAWEMPEAWATTDIYPVSTSAVNMPGTGFYYRHTTDPVWDWVPFQYGNSNLEAKLEELRNR